MPRTTDSSYIFLLINNLSCYCQAEYVEKLDAGLHSTKGVGKTEPDPAGDKELDGCKVTRRCSQWLHVVAENGLKPNL